MKDLMKNLFLPGVLVLLCLKPAHIKAQELIPVNQNIPDKPLLFAAFPEKIECPFTEFQKLFSSKTDDKLLLSLDDKFLFAGKVTERIQKNSAVISINIKSSNFPGALLTISQITQPGRAVRYTGRIVHPQQGDVWVIIEENNRYYLKKEVQKFFMTE